MRKFDAALREMREAKPDEERILRLTIEACNSGDHRAEYALATWYLHGVRVPVDKQKALDLLRRSSASGNSGAMYDLAVVYEEAYGVARDLKKAFAYYASAARQGDKQANFEVGRMLFYGIGTVKDKNLAQFWFDKARKYGVMPKRNDLCTIGASAQIKSKWLPQASALVPLAGVVSKHCCRQVGRSAGRRVRLSRSIGFCGRQPGSAPSA